MGPLGSARYPSELMGSYSAFRSVNSPVHDRVAGYCQACLWWVDFIPWLRRDIILTITRIISASKTPLYLVWLGLLYFTGTTVLTVLIDTPINAGLKITYRYLALPLAVLVFGYTIMRWRALPPEKRRWFTWPLALVIYFFVVVTAQSYVIAVSCIGASRQEVVLSGPILKKWTRSYKTTSHYIQIQDDHNQTKYSIHVSPAEYSVLAVGAIYSRTYLVGRLGIPYRWTLDRS